MKSVSLNHLPIIILCFIVMPAISKDLGQIEKWGDNLLKPVQLEDEQNILSGQKRHLLGIEDVRYVRHFVNCTVPVSAAVEKWKNNLNLVSRFQKQNDTEIIVEINTVNPVNGSIFIIYRFIKNKKYAYLKFLFDSNKRLVPSNQEKIVRAYKMIRLKEMLTQAMECG